MKGIEPAPSRDIKTTPKNLAYLVRFSEFHNLIREIEYNKLQVKHVVFMILYLKAQFIDCLLYTSPSPRDATLSRMPSSA